MKTEIIHIGSLSYCISTVESVRHTVRIKNVLGEIETGYPATFIEFDNNRNNPKNLIA